MRAGWLRHRVRIEEKAVMQNGMGEEVVTWSEVVTIWAGIEPIRGREFIEAQQEHANITTRIRTRHRRDIQPDMRAVWTDEAGYQHIYDIRAVIPKLEKRRQLELMCVEVIHYE